QEMRKDSDGSPGNGSSRSISSFRDDIYPAGSPLLPCFLGPVHKTSILSVHQSDFVHVLSSRSGLVTSLVSVGDSFVCEDVFMRLLSSISESPNVTSPQTSIDATVSSEVLSSTFNPSFILPFSPEIISPIGYIHGIWDRWRARRRKVMRDILSFERTKISSPSSRSGNGFISLADRMEHTTLWTSDDVASIFDVLSSIDPQSFIYQFSVGLHAILERDCFEVVSSWQDISSDLSQFVSTIDPRKKGVRHLRGTHSSTNMSSEDGIQPEDFIGFPLYPPGGLLFSASFISCILGFINNLLSIPSHSAPLLCNVVSMLSIMLGSFTKVHPNWKTDHIFTENDSDSDISGQMDTSGVSSAVCLGGHSNGSFDTSYKDRNESLYPAFLPKLLPFSIQKDLLMALYKLFLLPSTLSLSKDSPLLEWAILRFSLVVCKLLPMFSIDSIEQSLTSLSMTISTSSPSSMALPPFLSSRVSSSFVYKLLMNYRSQYDSCVPLLVLTGFCVAICEHGRILTDMSVLHSPLSFLIFVLLSQLKSTDIQDSVKEEEIESVKESTQSLLQIRIVEARNRHLVRLVHFLLLSSVCIELGCVQSSLEPKAGEKPLERSVRVLMRLEGMSKKGIIEPIRGFEFDYMFNLISSSSLLCIFPSPITNFYNLQLLRLSSSLSLTELLCYVMNMIRKKSTPLGSPSSPIIRARGLEPEASGLKSKKNEGLLPSVIGCLGLSPLVFPTIRSIFAQRLSIDEEALISFIKSNDYLFLAHFLMFSAMYDDLEIIPHSMYPDKSLTPCLTHHSPTAPSLLISQLRASRRGIFQCALMTAAAASSFVSLFPPSVVPITSESILSLVGVSSGIILDESVRHDHVGGVNSVSASSIDGVVIPSSSSPPDSITAQSSENYSSNCPSILTFQDIVGNKVFDHIPGSYIISAAVSARACMQRREEEEEGEREKERKREENGGMDQEEECKGRFGRAGGHKFEINLSPIVSFADMFPTALCWGMPEEGAIVCHRAIIELFASDNDDTEADRSSGGKGKDSALLKLRASHGTSGMRGGSSLSLSVSQKLTEYSLGKAVPYVCNFALQLCTELFISVRKLYNNQYSDAMRQNITCKTALCILKQLKFVSFSIESNLFFNLLSKTFLLLFMSTLERFPELYIEFSQLLKLIASRDSEVNRQCILLCRYISLSSPSSIARLCALLLISFFLQVDVSECEDMLRRECQGATCILLVDGHGAPMNKIKSNSAHSSSQSSLSHSKNILSAVSPYYTRHSLISILSQLTKGSSNHTNPDILKIADLPDSEVCVCLDSLIHSHVVQRWNYEIVEEFVRNVDALKSSNKVSSDHLLSLTLFNVLFFLFRHGLYLCLRDVHPSISLSGVFYVDLLKKGSVTSDISDGSVLRNSLAEESSSLPPKSSDKVIPWTSLASMMKNCTFALSICAQTDCLITRISTWCIEGIIQAFRSSPLRYSAFSGVHQTSERDHEDNHYLYPINIIGDELKNARIEEVIIEQISNVSSNSAIVIAKVLLEELVFPMISQSQHPHSLFFSLSSVSKLIASFDQDLVRILKTDHLPRVETFRHFNQLHIGKWWNPLQPFQLPISSSPLAKGSSPSGPTRIPPPHIAPLSPYLISALMHCQHGSTSSHETCALWIYSLCTFICDHMSSEFIEKGRDGIIPKGTILKTKGFFSSESFPIPPILTPPIARIYQMVIILLPMAPFCLMIALSLCSLLLYILQIFKKKDTWDDIFNSVKKELRSGCGIACEEVARDLCGCRECKSKVDLGFVNISSSSSCQYPRYVNVCKYISLSAFHIFNLSSIPLPEPLKLNIFNNAGFFLASLYSVHRTLNSGANHGAMIPEYHPGLKRMLSTDSRPDERLFRGSYTHKDSSSSSVKGHRVIGVSIHSECPLLYSSFQMRAFNGQMHSSHTISNRPSFKFENNPFLRKHLHAIGECLQLLDTGGWECIEEEWEKDMRKWDDMISKERSTTGNRHSSRAWSGESGENNIVAARHDVETSFVRHILNVPHITKSIGANSDGTCDKNSSGRERTGHCEKKSIISEMAVLLEHRAILLENFKPQILDDIVIGELESIDSLTISNGSEKVRDYLISFFYNSFPKIGDEEAFHVVCREAQVKAKEERRQSNLKSGRISESCFIPQSLLAEKLSWKSISSLFSLMYTLSHSHTKSIIYTGIDMMRKGDSSSASMHLSHFQSVFTVPVASLLSLKGTDIGQVDRDVASGIIPRKDEEEESEGVLVDDSDSDIEEIRKDHDHKIESYGSSVRNRLSVKLTPSKLEHVLLHVTSPSALFFSNPIEQWDFFDSAHTESIDDGYHQSSIPVALQGSSSHDIALFYSTHLNVNSVILQSSMEKAKFELQALDASHGFDKFLVRFSTALERAVVASQQCFHAASMCVSHDAEQLQSVSSKVTHLWMGLVFDFTQVLKGQIDMLKQVRSIMQSRDSLKERWASVAISVRQSLIALGMGPFYSFHQSVVSASPSASRKERESASQTLMSLPCPVIRLPPKLWLNALPSLITSMQAMLRMSVHLSSQHTDTQTTQSDKDVHVLPATDPSQKSHKFWWILRNNFTRTCGQVLAILKDKFPQALYWKLIAPCNTCEFMKASRLVPQLSLPLTDQLHASLTGALAPILVSFSQKGKPAVSSRKVRESLALCSKFFKRFVDRAVSGETDQIDTGNLPVVFPPVAALFLPESGIASEDMMDPSMALNMIAPFNNDVKVMQSKAHPVMITLNLTNGSSIQLLLKPGDNVIKDGRVTDCAFFANKLFCSSMSYDLPSNVSETSGKTAQEYESGSILPDKTPIRYRFSVFACVSLGMIRVEKKRKQYPCGIVEIIPNVSSLMRCIQHHMGPGPKKHAEREYIKYFSQEECPLHYNPKKYAQLVRESPPKLGIEAYQSISRSVQITQPSQWYSRLINFNESMAAWSVM
ncbi:hypothetical protein ADUPG1_010692, partial [Aduncisulcus paluster]